MNMNKPVITAASQISSIGAGVDCLAANLGAAPRMGSAGKYDFHEFSEPIPCFKADTFDPEQVLGKKGLRTKDWATKLLLATMELGFKAQFEASSQDDKPGICVGTAFGSVQSIGDFLSDSIVNGVNAVNPQAFANTVINSPTGNANIRYESRTLSTTVSTGFNAGADALIYACDYIRRGYLNRIVAGGLEEISYYALLGMLRSGVLSPTSRILPFGTLADGFVAGEGCAMFMVESAESAAAGSRTPLAEISGYASAFEPSTFAGKFCGESARHCMKAACDDAGIRPADVGFIASGANGIRNADAMEAQAIRDVFGDTPVTAYKARFGECYGASAPLSVACALADMNAGRITGVPEGYETIDALNCVRGTAAWKRGGFVMVNSFSCDGNCTTIVIKDIHEAAYNRQHTKLQSY